MQMVNIHQAKTQLSKLVDAVVEGGEEIIIARAGKPAAKLVPIAPQKPIKRRPGFLKGKIKITDDFYAPLPDDIQKYFEGEE
jgi:prevent-host-death family protein